jgi:glycine C-acetyltransferase
MVVAAMAALDIVQSDEGAALRSRVLENAAWFREALATAGYDPLPGQHPIVPIILGDAILTARFAERLYENGVFAVAFSYPVVPQGKARIRTQMSAAHSSEDMQIAFSAFKQAGLDLDAVVGNPPAGPV